jgi:hypothetical protein
VANLTASRVSRERLRKLRIFQADAYVSIDFAGRRAEVVTRRPGAPTRCVDRVLGSLADRAAEGGTSAATHAGADPAHGDAAKIGPEELSDLLAGLEHQTLDASTDPEPLAAEIAAFIDAVRAGAAPEPGAEDGLRAVKLAETVRQAIAASMTEARLGTRSTPRARQDAPS